MSEFLPPIVIPIDATMNGLVSTFAKSEAATRAFAKDEERILSQAGDDGGRAFGDGVGRGLRRSMASSSSGGGFGAILTRGLGMLGSLAVPTLFTGLIYGAAQAVAALMPLVGLVNLLPAGISALAMSLITLKIAFKGVGTALSAGLSGDTEKYAEALAKLAPAARSAVREMVALKPAMDAVKTTVQQNFWAPLVGQIRALGTQWLPLVRTELGGMATALGGTFRNVIDMMTHSEFFFDDIRTTMRNVTQAVRNADSALTNILKTFGTLSAVGSSFLPRMGTAFAQWTKQFDSFIARAAESGDLNRWIEEGISALKMLGGLLSDVWNILRPILNALNATSGAGLGFLGTLLHDLAGFLNSAQGAEMLTSLFHSLSVVFGVLSHALVLLLPLIGKLLVGLEPFFDQVGPALMPVLDQLAASLSDLLVAFLPLIGPITELTVALLPVLVPLLKMFSDIIVAIGPSPAIEMLNKGLIPALEWLTRVLTDASEWLHRFLAPAASAENKMAGLGATFSRVVGWFQALPRRAMAALAALPGIVLEAAQSAMRHLAYAVGYGVGRSLKSLKEFPGRVWDLLQLLDRTAKQIITETIIRWVQIFQEVPGKIWNALKSLPGKIKSIFSDAKDWLEEAGRAMVEGLIKGVASMWSKSVNFVKDLGKSLVQGFRDAVGWHSPAKMFVEGGSAIVAGVVKGVADNAAAAVRAVSGMLSFGGRGLRVPAFSLGGGGGGGGGFGGRGSVPQVITLQNRVYLDGKQLHAGLIQPAQRYKIRTGTTGLS